MTHVIISAYGCARSHASRRGAALLIVLATLMITLTAMTMLVRAATMLQLQQQIEGCRTTADDLLAAAEAPIQRWLKEESVKAVAPADATSPRFELLNEDLAISGRPCTLRITAFDQFGMVSLNTARSGSPLRLSISADLLRVIDKLDTTVHVPRDIAGLDWFASVNEQTAACRAFPAAQAADTPAIGEMIATHGRARAAKLGPGAALQVINMNTAPLPLVEAAMRLAGRGGFEQIRAARKEGKPSSAASLNDSNSTTPSAGDNTFRPQIVSTSSCWSFRIDVDAGPLCRSWWAVYQAGASASGDENWECVQRLAITD